MSSTIEGVINSLNIETNKFVLSHDTLALTPDVPSNIVYSLKAVKNHPNKNASNLFTIGAENQLIYLVDYDPSAKYEAWLLEILQKYEGHSHGIRDVSFNKDCSKLLTCCEDHSLRIWDPKTQKPLALFAGHTDFVTGGIFLNDRTVVSVSWDLRIRVWNVPGEYM